MLRKMANKVAQDLDDQDPADQDDQDHDDQDPDDQDPDAVNQDPDDPLAEYSHAGLLHLSNQKQASKVDCSDGLTSRDCESAAEACGLKMGAHRRRRAFSGNYKTKGCYAYSSGKYADTAFYGTIFGDDLTSADELTPMSSETSADTVMFRLDCKCR